ncbi:hypothetical protein C2R22_18040 [Salinigranum rubrum]|uniref:DUF7573 domain-containing protein n=1 Tax=Salinigranum rubrum TaxID=755307 RepID=A0A2I8VN21_9EURY|nr:zinc ribbon domain-containing protein [Salinigranum rubrum]AUV83311.1 hypothetical protein C2R22_18040 [Salinigranum rubrum]
MSENRSLDEFFPASDDADDVDGGGGADEGDGAGEGDDADEGDVAVVGDADADVDEASPDDAVGTPTGSTGDDEGDEGVEDGEGVEDDEGIGDEDGQSDEVVGAGGGGEEADLPRTTYRWAPDGDDCPVCGSAVERQWRDGDRFVCADCKEW